MKWKKSFNAPDLSSPLGKRDHALLELMYGSGLSVSEICSIPVNAIDTDEGFARVFGKGSKERVVPLGKHAILAVRNYLIGGRPFLQKEGTGRELFLSMRGKAISRKMVWVLVKQYAKKAGIEKKSAPTLTPFLCNSFLMGGADVRSVQEMLGHADIGTTQIYTHLGSDRLLDEHANFHPLARIQVIRKVFSNVRKIRLKETRMNRFKRCSEGNCFCITQEYGLGSTRSGGRACDEKSRPRIGGRRKSGQNHYF